MKGDWRMAKISNEKYMVHNDVLEKVKYVETEEEAITLRNALNKKQIATEIIDAVYTEGVKDGN